LYSIAELTEQDLEEDVLKVLAQHRQEIQNLGVRYLALFGSVACDRVYLSMMKSEEP
jgi:predicted nucleotidyltransferase